MSTTPSVPAPTKASSLRRWVTWFVLASIFAVACWFLSQWQLARLAEVKAVIARVEANYSAEPVELSSLAKVAGDFDQKNEFRPVMVTGHYLLSDLALVRNRPLNGAPGFEMFVPLQTESGQVYLIDRGWLPTGENQDLPDSIVRPTSSLVTVIGRIKKSAPDSQKNYDRGAIWQLGAPSAAEALRVLDLPKSTTESGFYLLLQSETDSSGTAIQIDASLKPIPKPEIDEGNHLSYAMQWLLFAIMAFFAIFWAIRQERIHRKMLEDPSFIVKKRKAVGAADAAIEDALVDAANRQ